MIHRLIIAALSLGLAATAGAAPRLTGVNLAGGEFGGLRSVYAKGYIYPSYGEIRAFRDMGVNTIRLPMRWERLQPSLTGPLDTAEMNRVDAVVATATGMGMAVVLDVHNYGRYQRQPLGSATVPAAALADLWERLAARYRSNPRVIFGLMNEPVRIGAADWAAMAARAVRSIRGTGAANLILVPGINWSGAHSWRKRIGLQSNAEALGAFTDPGNNFAFDFHQYFDTDSSGTRATCVSPDEATRRITVASDWLREVNGRGFLSEFGVSALPECQPVLRAALQAMAARPEWIGWTAWASSAWFGTYVFNLYPLGAAVPPQLATLRPFLSPARP